MNIDNIAQTIQDLAGRYGGLKPLKLYQLNNYFQLADTELLRIYLRMKDPSSTDVDANNEQEDVLDLFKKSFTMVNGGQTATPDGYMRFISAYNVSGVKFDYVTEGELADRNDNSLTLPSTTQPVIYQREGYFFTSGNTSSSVTVWYYGANTGSDKPLLARDKTSGVPNYDSGNSVQFVWPEYMYPQIIALVLQYIGVSVGDDMIIKNTLIESQNAS